MNIVLEILGYRVYECIIENADLRKIETKIISKNLLITHVGSEIEIDSINNEFKLERSVLDI